jgi:diguanylate cyclase (GGDEF)-like protein/PAS domain S-box-containing protein
MSSRGALGHANRVPALKLFQVAPLGGLLVSREGVIVDVNDMFCRVLAFDRAALVGRPMGDLVAANSHEAFSALLASPFVLSGIEVELRDATGSPIPMELFATPLAGGERSAQILIQAVDVRHHRDRRDALLDLAHVDMLTGLLNRRGFVAAAGQLLRVARRDGRSVSFFFIDVDGLKAINDRYGHTQGDRAIEATATLLRKVFRESDVVGRFGGDEFSVLALTNRPESTAELRERLVRAVEGHAATTEAPLMPLM